MKNYALIFFCLQLSVLPAQTDSAYSRLIFTADSLFEYKDYISAGYYYEKAFQLKPEKGYYQSKLEVIQLYREKFTENMSYCSCDSLRPASTVYLAREKSGAINAPVGFAKLFNEYVQCVACGYFSGDVLDNGLKFEFDTLDKYDKLPFVTKVERVSGGKTIDSCLQVRTEDTVWVKQWYDTYGKMWKQINSPWQPKGDYWILKVHKYDFIGRLSEYNYIQRGFKDTVSYRYFVTYEYDSLGRVNKVLKGNYSADSTRITFTYGDQDHPKTKTVVEYGYQKLCIHSYKYVMNKEGKLEEQLVNSVCP